MASLPYPLCHDCTANLVGMARMPYPPTLFWCKGICFYAFILYSHYRTNRNEVSEKPEIAHKMQFSIPKLLIIIGIVKNRAELFQVELANKKVCLYSCKLQFSG